MKNKRKIKIEHCDVTSCPECNLKAYNKGFRGGYNYKHKIPFKGKIK